MSEQSELLYIFDVIGYSHLIQDWNYSLIIPLSQQIVGRYFMGYWPSKLICILNFINQVGWGILGCIVAGQMFSAVNGGGMSIAVGCAVAAICIGLIAIFGIAVVHFFER